MVAIKIKNVIKKYKLDNEIVTAVNNLSFDFEYGKMYAIMGHSGSGKSTLIQCLGLLDNITSGEIYIDNEDISKKTVDEQNKLRNIKIGFVFQDYYLNNTMKAYENVMLPMLINKKYKNKNITKMAKILLCEVGLKDRIKHYPKQLSGGEQQWVAIARAIANNPDIILADEPTGNLDEENEKYILTILKKMANKGKCVIVVSHNPLIKEYADIVINMKKGNFMVESDEI